MTDGEIESVVSNVLMTQIPGSVFRGADVTSEIDFDGEPVLRITAHYERAPASRNLLINSVHAIRSELIRHGEERFVILSNDVVDERQLEPDIE